MKPDKVIDSPPTTTDLDTEHGTTTYKDMEHISDSLQSLIGNIVTTGEKKEEEKPDKVAPEEVQCLLKKYGATTICKCDKTRLPFVISVDKRMELCKKCKGAPCQRPDFDSYFNNVPTIEVIEGVLSITWENCEYQKAFAAKEKLKKGWHKAKMPNKYRNKTFSDYKVTADNAQAVKAAKEFVASGTGGLFFYGNPGTGKTFLASIVTQEFLKADKTAIFGDVPTLLEILRSSFDDKKTNITDLMENLSTVDLLVLDDLGTENPTEWAVERIYSIINQRYNAEKPVIVTSNFKLREIARRLNNPKSTYKTKKESEEDFQSVTGDRIVSRLAQMCTRVELKGADRRF